MSKVFLSKFTPSQTSKEHLRAIFVQRGRLLQHVLDGLQESVSTRGKHNYLLVGPRGIGKTHFVSLVSYALEDNPGYPFDFCIAWLREEEWGVSSYLDLLVRILRSLVDRSPDPEIDEAMDALLYCPPEKADIAAQELLLTILGKRTLVLIAENLDTLFAGLGDIGQKRFRSLIQESGQISIVATTPVLFADVHLQTSPFYGFFEVHHFDELTIQEARQLLLRLADIEKDEQLLGFINTPEGQARIQAIYHLAGGNHRVYVILCQFLRSNNLDQLVELMLEMIDDLTPYYQAQISALSNQQQKIVDAICDRNHALPVKDIAARCFVTPQTASSQLKELKDRRFVVSVQVGREQWYEIREPLLRMCIETKKQRGKPIVFLIELLRTWYSTSELKEIANLAEPCNQLAIPYLMAAWSDKVSTGKSKHKDKKAKNDEILSLEKQIDEAADSKDLQALLRLLPGLIAKETTAHNWHRYASCLVLDDQLLKALDAVEKAIAIDSTSEMAREHRLIILMNLGRFAEALSYTDEWLKTAPSDSRALDFRASLLAVTDKVEEALDIFSALSQKDSKNPAVWSRLAGTYIKLRRFDEGIAALDQALRLDDRNIHALSLKGYLCGYRGRFSESIRCFERALKLDTNDETIWIGMCMARINIEDYEGALCAAQSAMDVKPDSLGAHFWRVQALFCNRKWTAYRKELDALLKRSKKLSLPVGDLGGLLRFLLEKIQDRSLWRSKSEELMQACKEHDTVIQLASGLVNTVHSVVSEDVSPSAANDWLLMWGDLAKQNDAFAVALRLLAVAVEYKQTKNLDAARVLLSEEKDLFEKLLQEVTEFKAEKLFDRA